MAGKPHICRQAEYLGLQDAGRKVCPCNKTCGARVGAIAHTMKSLGICVLAPKEKWLKMRAILEKWEAALAVGNPELVHKELLADRSFLVYVTRAYPALVPYLNSLTAVVAYMQPLF
jgi:hypothetical protein